MKVLVSARVLLVVSAVSLSASCGGSSNSAATKAANVDAPLGLDEAGFALKQARVEELVKACMKRAGFDYVPVDPNATKAAITGTS